MRQIIAIANDSLIGKVFIFRQRIEKSFRKLYYGKNGKKDTYCYFRINLDKRIKKKKRM